MSALDLVIAAQFLFGLGFAVVGAILLHAIGRWESKYSIPLLTAPP